MKRYRKSTRFDFTDDRGQTMVFILLAVGLFLLAFAGFAVDIANMWLHRQTAQTAADAACTAGAMDLLLDSEGGSKQGGFTPGTGFDCSASSTTAPCQYAALNGYDGKNTFPGNDVAVSFPGSVAGVVAPPTALAATPFLRVDVDDHVKTFFSGLLTGSQTVDVRAFAVCGLVQATAPIPLIILKPNCTNTFQDTGSGNVAILGGPAKSIQVNSNVSPGASVTGSGTVDLSAGGPNFTGSNFGTFGGPATAPAGFMPGTTGSWSYPAPPISDPYAQLAPPSQPAAAPAPTYAAYGVHGCPDHTGSTKGPISNLFGCVEYHPGFYNAPIVVKDYTAIFEAGLYYFNIPAGTYQPGNCGTPGGCISKPTSQCNYALYVDSNGVLRPSTAVTTSLGDTSHGVTFYLSGPGGAGGYGSVFFGSNSGTSGARILDQFQTNPTSPADGTGATCPGGALPNAKLGLPSSVPGDVLLGPCSKDGTYFASATNGSTVGPIRGMIFFQDRNNGDNHGQPSMQGGGGLLMSGTMYFHNCPNSLTTGCNASTDYKAFLQFQGNSGSGTFLLGNITTDEFITAGAGKLSMQLNPNAVYSILKASLLR